MPATINADYINPFLIASASVLKDMCFVDAKVGKPYTKSTAFTDDKFLIMVGITGAMAGQVILCFPNNVALDIASKMCMMQLDELNELAKSAISELCNMILGNTATVFSTKGIAIDITPPTMCTGNMTFMSDRALNICIPLTYEEGKSIEINVAIKGD
jgi:chemotaxis protein CheX